MKEESYATRQVTGSNAGSKVSITRKYVVAYTKRRCPTTRNARTKSRRLPVFTASIALSIFSPFLQQGQYGVANATGRLYRQLGLLLRRVDSGIPIPDRIIV
jgi:hypothetical protein